MWVGYDGRVWSIVVQAIYPIGKRPLGRPKSGWKDCAKNVDRARINWRETAVDEDGYLGVVGRDQVEKKDLCNHGRDAFRKLISTTPTSAPPSAGTSPSLYYGYLLCFPSVRNADVRIRIAINSDNDVYYRGRN